MNWHDGLSLTWHLYGCGFKPWRTQIKTYFCYFWFWIEYDRVEENPSSQGGLENHHKTTN